MSNEQTNEAEPLLPAPEWSAVGIGGWHDRKATTLASFSHPPTAYEHGFQDGAFALGRELYRLATTGDARAMIAVLGRYHEGNAHPIKGWTYEGKRS